MSMKIGDIYYVSLKTSTIGDNTQSGFRPAVIFQNNIGNAFSNNVVVIPLTSQIKKVDQPTHVILDANENHLYMDSMALCENPITIPKSNLGKYIATCSENALSMIAEASTLASASIAYIPPNKLLEVQERCRQMNHR